MRIANLAALLLVALAGCTGFEESQAREIRKVNEKAEHIYRRHDERRFVLPQIAARERAPVPWRGGSQQHPQITKEFFRCRGSSTHPIRSWKEASGEMIQLLDCSGPAGHGLPLRDDAEFVYPVLIDLLNYIQNQTGKRVVITSGHRCPTHSRYVDPRPCAQTSRHLIGAAVDFYVDGIDLHKVIQLIQAYYQQPGYQKADREFARSTKPDNDCATAAWFNREVYIKLFNPGEGRDLDNSHTHPYICLQVRWDRSTAKRVVTTWQEAFYNFPRW
jgi:hypothetical protein